MDTPYFRAGAGAVIYRNDGQVLVFKRAGEDIWQFQQGGIDAGETPEATLWRELYEETALIKANFTQSHPYPTWTTYQYPDTMLSTFDNALVMGQAHCWWFLEIAADTTINLDDAPDKEFEDYKWLAFAEFMNTVDHSFKQPVYAELYEYFTTHILPTPTN